ncbi:MAG: peroxidase family protein [Paracoccaceae bacterium]
MGHGSRHFDILAPRSKFYHGPFGRICPDLKPWPGMDDTALKHVANELMIEVPGKTPGELTDPDTISDLEDEFGSDIPSGYTYFGQFIDHDITFDPTPLMMRRSDPNGLLNFRTPRLDLDNVYGRGPADQPYLYDPADKAKLAIGAVADDASLPDLPRLGGTAVIGDMRNDENSMVSQLQLAFLLAHNRLVDRARAVRPGIGTSDAFEMARTTLRWLYQHIVWHDYLRRILQPGTHACALALEEACGGRRRWICGLDDIYSWKHQPYMPVEFSVAAYRFGHSMVRNAYQTNLPVRGFGNFVPIFDNSGVADPDDLKGFRPMLAKNSVQWDWFLPMTTSRPPFPQMARKIDAKMSNALSFLHEGPAGDNLNILAFRNLKRGMQMGLPSGTDVARKFCVEPIELCEGEPDSLWYYILREAQDEGGNALGAVGSIIVGAVFAGLLKGDPCSWINLAPCWTPDDDPLLEEDDKIDDPSWTLASIIRLAGLKPDGIGFA